MRFCTLLLALIVTGAARAQTYAFQPASESPKTDNSTRPFKIKNQYYFFQTGSSHTQFWGHPQVLKDMASCKLLIYDEHFALKSTREYPDKEGAGIVAAGGQLYYFTQGKKKDDHLSVSRLDLQTGEPSAPVQLFEDYYNEKSLYTVTPDEKTVFAIALDPIHKGTNCTLNIAAFDADLKVKAHYTYVTDYLNMEILDIRFFADNELNFFIAMKNKERKGKESSYRIVKLNPKGIKQGETQLTPGGRNPDGLFFSLSADRINYTGFFRTDDKQLEVLSGYVPTATLTPKERATPFAQLPSGHADGLPAKLSPKPTSAMAPNFLADFPLPDGGRIWVLQEDAVHEHRSEKYTMYYYVIFHVDVLRLDREGNVLWMRQLDRPQEEPDYRARTGFMPLMDAQNNLHLIYNDGTFASEINKGDLVALMITPDGAASIKTLQKSQIDKHFMQVAAHWYFEPGKALTIHLDPKRVGRSDEEYMLVTVQ